MLKKCKETDFDFINVLETELRFSYTWGSLRCEVNFGLSSPLGPNLECIKKCGANVSRAYEIKN